MSATATTRPAAPVPPGPRLPKPVATALFIARRDVLLGRLRERYGDAYTVQLPIFGPTVVVSSPELVKQVFTASPDTLVFGEDSPLGKVLGPGSLFSLDGKEHLRERRLLLPPFHGERMKSYESIIEEETLRETARWRDGEDLPTLEPFMRITLNAILRAVFGAHGPQQQRLAELLPRFITLGSKLALLPWLQHDLGPRSPWGKLMRGRAVYDRIIDELIDTARADPRLEERADVLALLVQAHYDDGAAMSRTAIADELLTLLAAGHETTATSLAWAVERLRRHPELLDRLTAEADEGGNALRAATIWEIQRTRPVIVGTSRKVKAESFALNGWEIPKDHRIMVAARLIHNDARFFARPKSFEPDRFLHRKPDTYTWVPFGGGTRRCIGAAFAHMEMDVVLRILLTDFELTPTTERGERWRSRGIAGAPARGGLARVRRVDAPTSERT
ncbi:MAG TPA: cytochrome P450, partial [Solirubrobacteraceae bacterium]|nr:cytochrome P450 [Solirubrobacteraceae bacterium]